MGSFNFKNYDFLNPQVSVILNQNLEAGKCQHNTVDRRFLYRSEFAQDDSGMNLVKVEYSFG